jgi:hydroxyethylthiazole kinase-like sugar kinase family protein
MGYVTGTECTGAAIIGALLAVYDDPLSATVK